MEWGRLPSREMGGRAEDVGAPSHRAEGLLPASPTPPLTPHPTYGQGLLLCLFWSIKHLSWGARECGLIALPHARGRTLS